MRIVVRIIVPNPSYPARLLILYNDFPHDERDGGGSRASGPTRRDAKRHDATRYLVIAGVRGLRVALKSTAATAGRDKDSCAGIPKFIAKR